MIIIKEGQNNIRLTIAFINNVLVSDYKFIIKDTFDQYFYNLNVVDISQNKNLFSEFEITITNDINDEDLLNNVIFLTKNKRYYYMLKNNNETEIIDNGYLIYID